MMWWTKRRCLNKQTQVYPLYVLLYEYRVPTTSRSGGTASLTGREQSNEEGRGKEGRDVDFQPTKRCTFITHHEGARYVDDATVAAPQKRGRGCLKWRKQGGEGVSDSATRRGH